MMQFKSTEDYQNYQEERQTLLGRCNAIDQGISNLDENSGERAFWELIQNARDFGNGACRIKIELLSDKLVFAHRGEPFNFNSLLDLVMQNSSKDDPKADMIGRFGTGFMTTHAINEIVYVSGPYAVKQYSSEYPDGHDGFVYVQDFELNRSLRHDKEAAMREMSEEKKRVKSMYKEIPFYSTIDEMSEEQHWTRFVYRVGEEKRMEVSDWLDGVIRLMPFVLVINPEIDYVEVHNEIAHKHIVLRKGQRFEERYLTTDCRWKIVKDYITQDGQPTPQIMRSLQAIKEGKAEDMVILPPYLIECGSMERIPSLFMSFPLLGTERFGVNFIFHSKRFYPVEKRNNITLPREIPSESEQEKQRHNEAVLKEMMEALFTYYTMSGNDSVLTRDTCAVSFPQKGEDAVTDAFYQRLQDVWKDKVKSWHVIPTRVGKKAMTDMYVRVLHPDFYRKLTDEQRKTYEPIIESFARKVNAANGEPYLLPTEELIKWSETVVLWGNDEPNFYLNIDDVCKAIDGNCGELIRFLEFLRDSGNAKALSTYALFPNRAGTLRRKGDLSSASYLDADGYDLVKPLMGDAADKIIDEAFVELAEVGEFTREELHKAISYTCTQWRIQYLSKEKELTMPQEQLGALLRFCSAISQSEFKNQRGRLMPYICKIHERTFEQVYLPKMKENEEDFYKSVFNYAVDYTLYVVSKKGDEWLEEHRDLLLNFMREFRTSDGDEWMEKLNNYAVLPNRNGKLCLKDNLHRNNGVREDLAAIYKDVTNEDLNNVWIDEEYEPLFTKLDADTPEAIAKVIQEELRDELQMKQASDHKDVFKKIILKLGEDEEWRQWFYEVEERKQAILFNMQSGSVQKSLFGLMDLPETELAELARLSEQDKIADMLSTYAHQQQLKKDEDARFEHLHKIGVHVEKALRDEMSALNIDVDYPKIKAEDCQNGQDIKIWQEINGERKVIFYIEVKSKWDFTESAHMSTRQIRTACENISNYALCCVNLSPYKNEVLENLPEEIIIQQTTVKMQIGKELKDMMEPILEADKRPEEVQVKIADYRTNIGEKNFVKGEPFDVLLERIREIAKGNIQ